MKPLLLGLSGVGLATWSVIEAAARVVAQAPFGPESEVSVLWLFQLGVLATAAVILVRFGFLLAGWKRVLDKALLLAKAVQEIQDRQDRAERRADAHDEDMANLRLLVQEHASRIGLRDDLSKRGLGDAG